VTAVGSKSGRQVVSWLPIGVRQRQEVVDIARRLDRSGLSEQRRHPPCDLLFGGVDLVVEDRLVGGFYEQGAPGLTEHSPFVARLFELLTDRRRPQRNRHRHPQPRWRPPRRS
jgi:hypothetical protein